MIAMQNALRNTGVLQSGPDNIDWAVMMVLRSRYPPAPALAPTAWSSHRADLPMRMVAAKQLNLGLGARYLMG
jgi:hypothetical protein